MKTALPEKYETGVQINRKHQRGIQAWFGHIPPPVQMRRIVGLHCGIRKINYRSARGGNRTRQKLSVCLRRNGTKFIALKQERPLLTLVQQARHTRKKNDKKPRDSVSKNTAVCPKFT